MQRRERILGLVVAGLLLAVVGIWGAWRAVGMVKDRQNELDKLKTEPGLTNVLQSQLQGLRDRRTRLNERSLPAQSDIAKVAYADWLTKLVHEPKIELSAVKVTTLEEAPDKEHGFTRLKFQVDGRGSYPQLVRLLERFYSADHLHKITSLRVPPSKDLRDLSIGMTIEALALKSSANKEAVSTLPTGETTPEQLRADVAQLMLRHFFRANRAPQLGVQDKSTVTALLGRPVLVPLKGSDPDGDKLTYELLAGPAWLKLEGVSLSSTTNPPLGSYDVTVKITDDGLPPKSETKKFTIRVQPAPPPPVRKQFDHTKYAYLEGLFERGSDPEAWVTVRTTGKYLTLYAGEEVDVEGVKIKVLAIDLDSRTIEVQFPDGRKRTVPLGKSLGGE